MYLSDKGKYAVIEGVDGKRQGIAIHKYSPADAVGCLTTVSGKDNTLIEKLIQLYKILE